MKKIFEKRDDATILNRMTGERCIIVCFSNIKELFNTYYEILGDDLFSLEYERGYRIGKLRLQKFHTSNDPKKLVDKLLEIYEYMGAFKVIEWNFDPVRLEGKVLIKNSYMAEIFQGLGKTVCHNIAGYLAAIIEGAFKSDVMVKETKCLAQGDDLCVFEIRGRKPVIC